MDIFWIARLTILILLHQTSLYEASCVIDETTKVAAAGASNITVVIGAPGESVTFHVNTTDENAVLWCFGDKVIVIVDSNGTSIDGFHDNKYKPHCYVSEKGHALTVAPLRMEDAGKYFAKINGKAYIFTLHVFSKLAELTLTCEAHNCSDGSCHHYLQCSLSGTDLVNSTDLGNVSYSWRAGDQLLAEGPMLLVNKSLLDMRQPLTCTARNAVSSRSVPVANVVMLCAAITTPSPGTSSMGGIAAGVAVVVSLGLLLLALCLFCKYGVPWMRRRFWINGGSQDDSHGAAEDMDTQAESFL